MALPESSARSRQRPLALVTGASAGIGRAYADRLAGRGHDLVIVGRDAGRLDTLARELGTKHGVALEVFPADLSYDEEIDRLVDRVGAGPPLAVLVNNAGFGTKGRLVNTAPGPQAAMLHLHTLAPMRVTQAALPAMVARGSGAIVNVSSVAAFVFSPGSVNYCATKAYLNVFSEGLAAELRGTGVRVQALCPGFTQTEFHQRMGVAQRATYGARWLSAEFVVDRSLASLDRGGPVVCVPGARYRVAVAALRHVPRRLLEYLTRRR
jgi:short-subunit dehydrogenase